MPSGDIIPIATYGREDDYITANPEITFFKSVYCKRVHYGVEWNELTFTQQPAWGKSTSLILPRNSGDLINEIYAEITLPATANAFCYGVGNAIIKSVEISIGGVTIDKHTADWLNIVGELTTPASQLAGYDDMVFNYSNLTGTPEIVMYVPLRFWFNRNIGASLPLVALAYQDVKLIFEFETAEIVSQGDLASSTELKCRLFGKFIHLDSNERQLVASQTNECLIEQVQYNEFLITNNTLTYRAKLNMFSPVKELIWFQRKISYNTDYGKFDYSSNDGSFHTFTTARIMLNGAERFDVRPAQYFYIQPPQRGYRTPRTDIVLKVYDNTFTPYDEYYLNYIYMYSFALNSYPSGHCNFSRFNGVVLELKNNDQAFKYDRTLVVFAVNYNILRFNGNGSCGLMYSH